jgi:ferric-dicitrate binding protein FerR (iron transport regulator)
MSISDQQLLETMQDVGGLLFRRLTNELTLHEQIELDNWLNQQDPASRQFFEDCSDWDQVHAALSELYDFDEAAALADIQKKIQLEIQPTAPLIEFNEPGRKWKYYWMAAAVFLLIAGGAVFFNRDKAKTNIAQLPVEQRFHNDVSPGGDKAVLELADGSKIVLDNASNGALAQQGATQVMKLDNGQLAYQIGRSGAETTNPIPDAIRYNTISTPRGGQYQVVLPDGSKVWLNAVSSLRFPTSFTGKERRVELNGEAYFDITRNASMPFKVVVAQAASGEPAGRQPLEIEVTGTEFDLMAYGDEDRQKVTVISGAIKAKSGNEQLVLQPNQQAFLDNKSTALNLTSISNLGEVTAWKDGFFQFQDASIESIMRQAARWYDVEVIYDGKVSQQFIGKVPRQVNLSTLLKILEATGWVHFRIDGKKVTVSP